MLHVGPNARVAFAAAWIGLQATLVGTAAFRPDHVFGFWMFSEASTMRIRLTREVKDGTFLPAPRGEWSAPDRAGRLHPQSWHDRVRDPILGAIDARAFASYGAAAQLARLQQALDDVVDHIPDDAQTTRLRAEAVVWKNGADPSTFVLTSHARTGL